MDVRIFYIIFSTVIVSNAEPCLVYFGNLCTYTVTCTNYVDPNLDWGRFHYSSGLSSKDEMCQNTVNYGGYRIYRIELVFKQTLKDSSTQVPNLRSWGGGNILNVIQSLDLSEDGYTETPIIRSMQNLVKLNMSRNLLTTAVLSNPNELSMLTELDLSHNTINDIQIENYQRPYKKLIKIDISHNYLVKIPNAIFDEFDDLQSLDLSYNYIDTLSQFTFEGMKKLTHLNLSYNRLVGINSSLFRFSELKVLNLSGNRIKDLIVNDFQQLHKLETLDLSSNFLVTVNVNVFNAMVLLENLDLSNNQIEITSDNTFSSFQSLRSVNLSKNKIKCLPKGLFKNASITTFYITDNILEGSLERGMFEGINVTKLDLSNQYLTEVKDYAFYNLNRLTTLLLNSNSLQSLSNMCFKSLTNLQQLDLSHNRITNIDFSKEDLSNLQSLLLKNNHLTEIKHEQLQHLSNLEFIDLSENQISRLEPSSFQPLRNLINLEINSNPLVGTLETGTFDGLVLLPSLDISHNMLTTIQNGSFKDMIKLTILNMSSCEISELEYNTFVDTGYIETLDLSYNKLKEFSVNTTELVGISTLLLNNNLIKTISSATFSDLSRLNKILLSHNIIRDIHRQSFNSLIDLRHLDLSYNEQLNFTVEILEKNKNLNTLILSGIKAPINFEHIMTDCPITDLRMSNSSIKNITELSLGAVVHLDSLDLSYNNISKLQIGDFSGIGTLRYLDLSFNRISFIQPGIFKDNSVLYSLNVSHNCLSSIGYGIFRGLIYLSILDMSYNSIDDLQSERFYEVKGLTELIVDNNKIVSINAEEFVGTSLTKLSIGDNPLPCQILVQLRKNGIPFEITAIKLDEHSNENVNGVTCNKDHITDAEPTHTPDRIGDNINVINALRNILYNLTNENKEKQNSDIEYLEKISNILEKSNSLYNEKLSDLANLTSKVIVINNNTNMMMNKLTESLSQIPIVTKTTTPVPLIHSVTTTTTHVPLKDINDSDDNKTMQVIPYINKIKKELEHALVVQKQDIMNEIESKLHFNNYQTESLTTSIGHEKLVLSNDSTKSLFTETCVALILLILVGLVLFKFYKSRMFIRNRFSYSTRELPGAMENSAL